MITLGPQLYTVREFTQTEAGIEETFRKCRDASYETVQLSGNVHIPADNMKALMERYGIDVCCTHTPFDRLVNDLDEVIREHQFLGIPIIGLGSAPRNYTENSASLMDFIGILNGIAHKIKEAGLQFAYHNHSTEFQKFDGVLMFDRLLAETDPDEVHFIPDTFWLQMGGVNPADYLRNKLKGRVEVCHFKDLAVEEHKPVFAEVGEGNLDLLECFKACMEIGVRSIVIEQDICPRDPFDCLAHSYENLMKLAYEAGDRT